MLPAFQFVYTYAPNISYTNLLMCSVMTVLESKKVKCTFYSTEYNYQYKASLRPMFPGPGSVSGH